MLGLLKAAWEPVHHARMCFQYRAELAGKKVLDPVAIIGNEWWTVEKRDGRIWTVERYGVRKTVTSWDIRHVDSFRVLAGYEG